MSDLRTLVQAVVDAAELPETNAVVATCRALGDALGIDGLRAEIESAARTILAALNAERAQGYARAMGDVVAEVQTRTEAAVSSYYADRSSYREGYSDACDTLCELVQHMAQTQRD